MVVRLSLLCMLYHLTLILLNPADANPQTDKAAIDEAEKRAAKKDE